MEESQRTNWIAIGITVVLSIALVAGIIVLGSRGSNKNGSTSRAVAPVTDSDWSRGSKDAKVTIISYEDFQCPACGAFQSVLDNIRAKYPNDIRFVFRHFPLTELHENAQKAAEAAEAAGAQGKFFEMHDKMFASQTNLSVDNLKKFATELGLDTERFNRELDDGTYAGAVREDRNTGEEAGVNGTPTLFINGTKYTGRLNQDAITAEIVKLLAQ